MKKLLVISSYPPRGTTHHKSVIGGASYTKNTLIALEKEIRSRNEIPQITVLAQNIDGSDTDYQDGDINVKRIWKRNSLFTFTKLYKEILINHKQTKEIMIELELSIFGKSGIFLMMLINFIYSLKLLNKKVVLVIHEVIFDMDKFGPHINLKEKSLKTTFYNSGFSMFYKSILMPVDKVIVFEESLKKKLSAITGRENKINVISIAVENIKQNVSKEKARAKLSISKNDFVVMTFGFLAWYKGTDWLSGVWSKENSKKNLQLIIAGGENPNRIDFPYYKKYLDDLKQVVREKEIILTGFIPEEKMQLYFAACDLVVFPYRTMMSSSAVLSIAFSFEKPFLLSENMNQIFMGQDINQELLSSNLQEKDVLFPLDNSFNERLESIKNDSVLLKKLELFSKKMKVKRSWDLIARKYYETIF